MNCVHLKIKSKKYNKYFYCNVRKEQIIYSECRICKDKKYKSYKNLKKTPIKKTNNKKSNRSKATDITRQVKLTVFLRDNGKCVVCGNSINVMPNAHYISRQNGGLGIEENIVTLCTELTENKCHRKYDFGTKEEQEYCRNKIKKYLESKYKNWDEKNLIYKKHERKEK